MPELIETHRQQLQAFLSDWQGSPVVVSEIASPENNGFSAITYLLQARVGERDVSWVVQVAPEPGTGLFDHYDMGRSFRLQADLLETDAPVAPMLTYCEDPAWLGQQFYVMEFVPGRVPPDRPSYHVGGWLREAGSDTQRAVWRSGLQAMARLHQVNVAGFDYLDAAGVLGTGDTVGHVAQGEINLWREFCSELLDFGDSSVSELTAALATLAQTVPGRQPLCVGWGDAKLGNMIFTGENVSAILDWELCCVGTPQQDLAHWLAVDWFLSAGIGKDRLPALPHLPASVQAYQAVNDQPMEHLPWWFQFALVRMGMIFHKGNQRSFLRDRTRVPRNPLLRFLPEILDGRVWHSLSQ